MQRIEILASLPAVALSLLLGAVSAQAVSGPPAALRADPAERLENRLLLLGLDDETRKQVFAILDGARPEVRELRLKLRNSQQTLTELMRKDEPAEATVLGQIDEIGQLTTELRKKELATWLGIRAKLNPEQRAKLRPERRARADKPERGCGKKAPLPRNISLGILPL